MMYSAHFLYTLDFIKSNENAFMIMLSINILMWASQFVGHGVFEGRKPALLDNLLTGTLKILIQVCFSKRSFIPVRINVR
jgi:uncharacterized membrane protein YGL010W